MKWEAGMMVGEQIRLARPLGGGSKGSVWVADQLDWRKQVAVKLVTQGLPLNDPDRLVGFIEAAAAAAQLECPHLAQALDHGLTDDGVPYVVMALLEGRSLEQRLAEGLVAPTEVGRIVVQVAQALGCVHEAGLVHGGIDPSSIFLCAADVEPDVRVLGLGIASARAPQRTNDYLAPEQYLLRPADARSDLWSLGAVAYRMLTGELPVSLEQRRKLDWSVTPPSEMWLTDVPDGVDRWFDKALSKRPEARFASAPEMAAELVALMSGLEGVVGAEQSSPSSRAGIGAHPVIAVGHVPEQADEPEPDSEPEAVRIEVDD